MTETLPDDPISITQYRDFVKGVIKMKSKKKAAEILKEIDSDLDTVLSILTKLALVAMSIKTIAEILMNI